MSNLITVDKGRVLVNRTALRDPAVKAVLTRLHKTNYEFTSSPSDHWYISDHD